MAKYITAATGRDDEFLCENEHTTLRAATADARRLIASTLAPALVEIQRESTGETVWAWPPPISRPLPRSRLAIGRVRASEAGGCSFCDARKGVVTQVRPTRGGLEVRFCVRCVTEFVAEASK